MKNLELVFNLAEKHTQQDDVLWNMFGDIYYDKTFGSNSSELWYSILDTALAFGKISYTYEELSDLVEALPKKEKSGWFDNGFLLDNIAFTVFYNKNEDRVKELKTELKKIKAILSE